MSDQPVTAVAMLGLVTRAEKAEAEAELWREEAFACYVASGAHVDVGDDARHLNPGEAREAVEELRREASMPTEMAPEYVCREDEVPSPGFGDLGTPSTWPAGVGWSAPDEAIRAAWVALEATEGVPTLPRNVVAGMVAAAFLAVPSQPEDDLERLAAEEMKAA